MTPLTAEATTIGRIEELLGDEAQSLLSFTCTGIPKSQIHVPGPDHLDRVFLPSDRNAQTLVNMNRMIGHGRLAASGYLSILPVDQGIEHSGAASFAPNPAYFDPENIIRLAVEGGCNATASTLGVLGAVSRRWAHRIPFVVKQANAAEVKSTFWIQELAEKDGAGKPKPVLIFGAGYDTNKDDHDGLANGGDADTTGRGMFIVDAETGDLLWSVTPAANSTSNMQETGLLHSIAAPVSVLDSNGDELVDRVYLADTGGNVWRVDMAGNSLPGSSQDTWFITRLFRSNDGTKGTDRRFFSSLDIVRTTIDGQAVDAVMLGSGDRTNPAELDDPDDGNNPSVDNEFFMIKDEKVWPYFEALDQDECDNDPTYDFRCQLPLDPNALYDATDNLIQVGTDDEKAAARAALAAKHGWRLRLGANGEKSLARSLTIAGNVYFTTFSPDAVTTNLCEPVPGTGRLYIVNLFDAREVHDFDPDEGNGYERSWIIGGLIPDTPSAHFGSDGEIRLLLPPGGGADGPAGNPFETGAELPEPYGSYWYREEQ